MSVKGEDKQTDGVTRGEKLTEACCWKRNLLKEHKDLWFIFFLQLQLWPDFQLNLIQSCQHHPGQVKRNGSSGTHIWQAQKDASCFHLEKCETKQAQRYTSKVLRHLLIRSYTQLSYIHHAGPFIQMLCYSALFFKGCYWESFTHTYIRTVHNVYICCYQSEQPESLW